MVKKFHIIQLEDDQRLCSSGLIWYLSDSVDQKYETLFCENSTYSEAALKLQFLKIMQNSIIIKVTCISNFNESTKAYLLNETSKYLLVSNSKYVSNLI